MQKAKYIRPEILTLGSEEIVRLVGPAQGYDGLSGGDGTNLSDQMLGTGSGTSNVNQR